MSKTCASKQRFETLMFENLMIDELLVGSAAYPTGLYPDGRLMLAKIAASNERPGASVAAASIVRRISHSPTVEHSPIVVGTA